MLSQLVSFGFVIMHYAQISQDLEDVITQGKDRIVFLTKEDHATPSKITIPDDDDDEPAGAILPNGEINWNCPCLGGMVTGPCGVEFREAFSCFQYSTATPKGSDCFQQFHEMQDCTSRYPNLYPQGSSSMDDVEEDDDDLENDVEHKPDESTTIAPSPAQQEESSSNSKSAEASETQ